MFIDKNGKRINPYASLEVGGITFPGNILEFPDAMEALGITEQAEPEPPAEYLEHPDWYYRTEQDDAPWLVYTRKSEEQISAIQLSSAKAKRAFDVAAITVTTSSGNTFDGNEEAQGRMARAVLSMTDAETRPWVLADNTVASVTRPELQEALRLAVQAMDEAWVRPYQPIQASGGEGA